jgi:hypothetical protein
VSFSWSSKVIQIQLVSLPSNKLEVVHLNVGYFSIGYVSLIFVEKVTDVTFFFGLQLHMLRLVSQWFLW